MTRADIDQRPEINIHHRARHHADPRSQHIVAQLHPRQAKRIVQQREREDRREARQEHDLPSLIGHRPVNGGELLVPLDLPRDGIARQIAAHQKRRRRAQRGANGHTDRAQDHAEHGAGPKREHRPRNEQHRRHHVEADENHRPPRPKLANPVQRFLQQVLDMEVFHRQHDGDGGRCVENPLPAGADVGRGGLRPRDGAGFRLSLHGMNTFGQHTFAIEAKPLAHLI